MHVKCTCTLKEPQISCAGVFLFVTKGNKNPSPFCTLLASRLFFSQQALYIITVIFKQRSMTNLLKVHKLVCQSIDQTLTFSVSITEIFASSEVEIPPLHKLTRHALPPAIYLRPYKQLYITLI